MHVKLQIWFPFLIQVYVNGREMMKHIFDENGISYQMYDNSFFEISDIAKAQELADKFDSKSLCRQLDLFAHKVNPYLDTIEKTFHQGCHWCVDQCEHAADVMLQNREVPPDIYPIKFKMKSNSIKVYDKFSCLRVEVTINDPKEFKVYKDVHHKDGTTSRRRVPMRKSISNLYQYAEISKAANRRKYAMADIWSAVLPTRRSAEASAGRILILPKNEAE